MANTGQVSRNVFNHLKYMTRLVGYWLILLTFTETKGEIPQSCVTSCIKKSKINKCFNDDDF